MDIKYKIICDQCASDYVEIYDKFPPAKPHQVTMSEFVKKNTGPQVQYDVYYVTHRVIHCKVCGYKVEFNY